MIWWSTWLDKLGNHFSLQLIHCNRREISGLALPKARQTIKVQATHALNWTQDRFFFCKLERIYLFLFFFSGFSRLFLFLLWFRHFWHRLKIFIQSLNCYVKCKLGGIQNKNYFYIENTWILTGMNIFNIIILNNSFSSLSEMHDIL